MTPALWGIAVGVVLLIVGYLLFRLIEAVLTIAKWQDEQMEQQYRALEEQQYRELEEAKKWERMTTL